MQYLKVISYIKFETFGYLFQIQQNYKKIHNQSILRSINDKFILIGSDIIIYLICIRPQKSPSIQAFNCWTMTTNIKVIDIIKYWSNIYTLLKIEVIQ